MSFNCDRFLINKPNFFCSNFCENSSLRIKATSAYFYHKHMCCTYQGHHCLKFNLCIPDYKLFIV